MWQRRNSHWLMVTAMCGFYAPILRASSNVPLNLSEFYIVSTGYSDALPGWHRSVLEVKPDGTDMLVRYIRVGPAGRYCWSSTSIVATRARLPNSSLQAVTAGVNLCAVDPPSLSRTIRTFPQTQRIGVFAADRYTIVAKCGAETRVIGLPEKWELDMARLKRKRPEVAALWTLENTVGTRAFGPFPYLDVVPPEMAARLKPADEAILSELKSGKFDVGLAPQSFKDDVTALRHLSHGPEFSVKLANADPSRFTHYADPKYPSLARQARVSGRVELELTSNVTTGEMEQVTVISGHPLLVQAAKESARQWSVLPGADTALRAESVVLEFAFHCP